MTFFKRNGGGTVQDIFNSVGVEVYLVTKSLVGPRLRTRMLIAGYDPLTEGIFGPLQDASQAPVEDVVR